MLQSSTRCYFAGSKLSIVFLFLSKELPVGITVILVDDNWNVQAPVSDREYRATLPETPAMIDLASSMISEGRGSELMPREADPTAPITAYRWVYS